MYSAGYDLNGTVNNNKYECAIANQYNIFLIVLCTEQQNKHIDIIQYIIIMPGFQC